MGIAVLCILIVGFFVYRVKFRQPRRSIKGPTPKSSPFPPSSSSGTRFSKQPPSPFQLGSRSRHPLEDSVSRSASHSSNRSLHPSNLSSSRPPLTERSYRAGDVMEITPIGYQHTNSSITPSVSASAYNPTRRISEGAVGAGALISEYKPYALPSRSHERLSSATGTGSMIDSNSYTSRSHLVLQSQVTSSTTPEPTNSAPARRPLPVPPHPPPAYEQVSNARPEQTLSPIQNIDTKGRIRSIDADPLTGSTLAGMHSPNAKIHPHNRSQSLDDIQPHVPSLEAGVIPVLSSSTARIDPFRGGPGFMRRSHEGPSSSRMEDDGTLDMETAMTPHSHRRHPSSGDNDPFVNINYELPAWLNSDPYAAQTIRPSASQPSLYGAVARSVAASSRVLPSDSSTRTLTPEPLDSPLPNLGTPNEHQGDAAYQQRFSLAPTYTSAAPSARPVSAIEGDGPPVDEVLIFHGAERPGWAQHSPLPTAKSSGSQSRRRFPTDGFEANDLHPTARSTNDTPGATTSGSRSADRDTTFMSLSPLSEVIPGQGLSRAFSLDAPQRRTFSPRGRGRIIPRSPLGDRPFSNFSSLRVTRTGVASGSAEEHGWLEHDQILHSAVSTNRTSASGVRGRASMAPSSNVLPNDIMSIRSISPEVGWMDYPGSAEEEHAQEHLAVIKEAEHDESSSNPAKPEVDTSNTNAGSTEDADKTLRMSIGEDGLLWGRLTSAMEEEQSTRP